jgi:hypothetical protein
MWAHARTDTDKLQVILMEGTLGKVEMSGDFDTGRPV